MLKTAFEQFFLNSPMGIHLYELTADDRLVFMGANPAADTLLGVDNRKFVGKTIEEAFPPLADTEVPGRYRRAAKDNENWRTEQVIYEDEQIKGAFEVRAFQIGPGRMAAMFLDITQRKRDEEERTKLQAQIQHAQKLESLGVLAGGIAHDFNNLLAGVLGNASVALSQMPPESAARANVLSIEKTAQRAAELVNQLLAYSGRGRFVEECIDLKTLVEEMAHLLEVSISKNVTLAFNFGEGVPPVKADPTQIRQVVMNLITNASEAIGDKNGVVWLGTGSIECDSECLASSYLNDRLSQGTYSFIEVSDNGVGMDAKTKESIFDPFFSTKFTGRGLGMAAVLGIVRGHRGAIELHSELGKGTAFKVLFPAAEKSLPLADAGPIADDFQGSGTVMLVDDSDTVRTVGERMLAVLGFDVVVASDGQQALELFRERPEDFRCVILDMTMPKLDGEVCFREMRRVRDDIPVILSSGYNEQDFVVRFAGKGLGGFIQKPYTLGALREKIAALLGSTEPL